jgi:hypothetical protein
MTSPAEPPLDHQMVLDATAAASSQAAARRLILDESASAVTSTA